MKTFASLLLGALVCALATTSSGAPETSMFVTSNDFSNGGTMPPRLTCEGGDTSPSLRIAMVPQNAKSLVLIMDDPDAPSGTVTHWLVWNISPNSSEFSTGSVPTGAVQGTNDMGKLGYKGPCPPSGVHRYYFRVYAVARPLNLPTSARRADVDKALEGNVLGQAVIMGRYGRSNASPTP